MELTKRVKALWEKIMWTFFPRFFLLWRTRRIGVLVMAVVALALSASKAAAQPTTHLPVPIVGFNLCTGEAFAGAGFLHVRTTLTTAPNFHMGVEVNLESAQGTTVTGVRYVAPSQNSFHQIIDSDFVPANATSEEMLQFIRQGEDGSFVLGDDFYVRTKLHVTVNANGEMTVDNLETTFTCR